MSDTSPSDLENAERTMAVAYSVIGAVVLGAIGYGLDLWLGTRPWLAIAGLVIGAVIALSGVRALISSRS